MMTWWQYFLPQDILLVGILEGKEKKVIENYLSRN